MKSTKEVYLTNRDEWREWLEKYHDAEKEVWLIYYKRHAGKPRIPYDDAVEEALCFGWIDSIVKKVDEERFAQKFTPRKSKSRWSELNKKRARKMIEEGKMTERGFTRIREAKRSGEWFQKASRAKELVIPLYIGEALSANKKALDNFNKLAKSFRRQYIGWINSAKREETRKRRLAEAIKLLMQNKKLGMK